MRCAALLTSALLLLAACDADDPVTGPDGEETSANPLDVTISLDQSRSASALIQEEGGTISTTAADGKRFTLTIPAGALFSEEQITITPVATVNGLPLSGGLIGAVQLEPEGLRLVELATLTIEGSGGVTAQEATGIAWLGSGTDFHLYPVEVSGSTITLRVIHFSGYGSGKGTSADREKQKQRGPRSSEAAFEQSLSPPTSALARALEDRHSKVMENVKAAETNSAKLDAAFTDFVAWFNRVLQHIDSGKLTPAEGARLQALRDQAALAFQLALVNALSEALDRCRTDALQGAVRILQLMDFAGTLRRVFGSELFAGIQREWVEKAKGCLSFELEFDSRLEVQAGPTTIIHVHATVPLRMSPLVVLEGQAPPDLSTFEFRLDGFRCPLPFTMPMTDVFAKLDLDVSLSKNAQGEVVSVFKQIRLLLDPGKASGKATITCRNEELMTEITRDFPFEGVWPSSFEARHSEEREEGLEDFFLFRFSEAEIPGRDPFARKTFETTIPGGGGVTLTEKTVLTLFHRPGG